LIWSPQQRFVGLGLSATAIVKALLYGALQTGFTEELLFRGLIAGSLSRRLPMVWANIGQALLFLVVRESAKTRSKEMARRAENARRRDLEESYHGLKKRMPPRLFSVAADEWLTLKKPTLAARSVVIEEANLKHLLPSFGKLLITDIDGKDISRYQQHRLEEEASPKTVNLEIGTLRAILRRNRLWAAIQPDTSARSASAFGEPLPAATSERWHGRQKRAFLGVQQYSVLGPAIR
jgi:hypothetical protein